MMSRVINPSPILPWTLMSLLMVPLVGASTLASIGGNRWIGLSNSLEVFEILSKSACSYMQPGTNFSYNTTPMAFDNNLNNSCGGAARLPDSKNTSIVVNHNNTTPLDILPLLYILPILWPGFHNQRCRGIQVRCTSDVTLPCGAVPHLCPNVSIDAQVIVSRIELDTYMHAFNAFSRSLPVVFADPMHALLKQAMEEHERRGPVYTA